MSAHRGKSNAAPTLLLALALATAGGHCAPREPERSTSSGQATSALFWEEATPPIRIRTGHTSTLLGTGEILVAGGGATPQSTELVDPFGGRVTLGPTLLEGRTNHTATMLLSGKVLLAGGEGTATAELYDPLTRTTTATGSMSRPRRRHVAIRLRSGQVLVMGGGDAIGRDPTNELYDPATGTWSPVPDRPEGTGARSAVTLANGRVLVGSASDGAGLTTQIYDPTADSPAAWTTVASALPDAFGTMTLTRLFDGRVFATVTAVCASTGGPMFCDTQTAIFDPAGSGTTTLGPNLQFGRDQHSAARTIDGRVLVIGGFDMPSQVERFDPPNLGSSFVHEGDLAAPHSGTATVLPGGDVVVIGGTQATIDRRISVGAWTQPAGFKLAVPRASHSAVRLHDGRVLVTGGEEPLDPALVSGKEAEIIDVAGRSTTRIADMTAARKGHTMTALRSGKVLVAGGGTATAEIFDPAGASGGAFTAIAPMSTSRSRHTATLLPSGKVLIVGGDAEGTAELFDPDAATFAPLGKTVEKRSDHGAVLMPNGLVLVVGGGTAEIFDPNTSSFRATTPPGSSRDGRTAHLLTTGKVIALGGATLAADLFDPATETWSFSSPTSTQYAEMQWTGLPDGRLLSSGGRFPVLGLPNESYLFDPIAQPSGRTVRLPTQPGESIRHTATLAGTGEVIVAGGDACYGPCLGNALEGIRIYSDAAPLAQRPTIASVPAKVVAGTRVTITGAGFANAAEASDGTRASSAVNHPLALWVSDAGDAVVSGTIVDFTDTTATWLVPATALYGHGQLFVAVAGILSRGASVSIEPAQAATGCSFDAECSTGFCVDGVCCDRRCDGLCEGCSALRKTSGEDGVCGPVPPGRDIAGRCVLKLGDACTAKEECASGFCAQGVCCDSACEGQCLACNLEGRAGQCSAINEGACGAACDGDHTIKQVGVPDVDCAPYKCSGPQCNTTCASVRDCVAPAVCSFEGQCVPPTPPSPSDDSVCGCRAVGASAAPGRGPTVAALALALAVALRRRRGRLVEVGG